jgi:hypothetical protein
VTTSELLEREACPLCGSTADSGRLVLWFVPEAFFELSRMPAPRVAQTVRLVGTTRVLRSTDGLISPIALNGRMLAFERAFDAEHGFVHAGVMCVGRRCASDDPDVEYRLM